MVPSWIHFCCATVGTPQLKLFIYLFIYFCFFAISWATPAAYRDSQARGLIGAVATSLCHSHSHSQIQAMSVTQLTRQRWILDPLSEARDGTCNLMVPSWICFHCTTEGTQSVTFLGSSLQPHNWTLIFLFCKMAEKVTYSSLYISRTKYSRHSLS